MTYAEFIKESIAHEVNWDEYAKKVSAAYDEAPVFDEAVVHHWNSLNKSNHILFKRIQSKVKVEFVKDDPYPDQPTMKKEVERTGLLKIYSGDNDHPLFSKEDNLIFRAVHDYITHILTNTPFGMKGELRAANTHMKMVPVDARPALFTEVVAQTCSFVVHNKFPIQKIAVLPGFSYTKLGVIEQTKVAPKKTEVI